MPFIKLKIRNTHISIFFREGNWSPNLFTQHHDQKHVAESHSVGSLRFRKFDNCLITSRTHKFYTRSKTHRENSSCCTRVTDVILLLYKKLKFSLLCPFRLSMFRNTLKNISDKQFVSVKRSQEIIYNYCR